MAFRIEPTATTSFRGAAGALKRPRIHDSAYLGFVRSLPSLITGGRPVEAAHIRYPALELGKRPTGKGEKPDDRWAVPLAPELHRQQHAMNERTWWKQHGIDPVVTALALYGAFRDGDRQAAEHIVMMAGR